MTVAVIAAQVLLAVFAAVGGWIGVAARRHRSVAHRIESALARRAAGKQAGSTPWQYAPDAFDPPTADRPFGADARVRE